MLETLAFFLVILCANIIQGITGFAGTILAMPFGLMLVGYPVAKPVLNVLGLLSGVYVLAGNRDKVNWAEVKRIVAVMAAGILAGIFVKGFLAGKDRPLYLLLGLFVIILSLQGLVKQLAHRAEAEKAQSRAASFGLLGLAGLVHGIFVSGGPLLIGYLSCRVREKAAFRATISTVWIVLNSLIFADDLISGLWTPSLGLTLLASLPFLLAGMAIGGILVKKLSQHAFMLVTYALLLVSGISLLAKVL